MRSKTQENTDGKLLEQAIATHPAHAENARAEMAQLVEVIARSNKNIDAILSTSQTVDVKGGFIAEEFHAETFNMDAILKGDEARACTDRYEEWSELEWNGAKLKKNDIPDIAVRRDNKVSSVSQAKYYDSAETTAKEMSQVTDGKVKYEKVDSLLGPEDQVNASYKNVPGESEPVATTTIKEHAEAKADALKAQGGDKTRIKAYRQTAAKTTHKLSDGKVSSTGLSKPDANKIGSGDKSRLKDLENDVMNKSTGKKMTDAGLKAGAATAISTGVKCTLRYIQMVNRGEITKEEATLKIVCETAAAAADSAVKAASISCANSMLERYGSETVLKQALATQSLNSMLKSNTVTVGVTCAVEAVKDLVRLGTGEISSQEFFDRQGKGMLTTSAGVAGGIAGASAGVAVGTSLGFSAGSTALAAAEVLGGISGGLIAGLALTLAIENGVEKPYRDLLRNTENLRDAAQELNRLSQTMFKGQVLFTQYLVADAQMEQEFQNQMRRVDEAGKRALDAINKI